MTPQKRKSGFLMDPNNAQILGLMPDESPEVLQVQPNKSTSYITAPDLIFGKGLQVSGIQNQKPQQGLVQQVSDFVQEGAKTSIAGIKVANQTEVDLDSFDLSEFTRTQKTREIETKEKQEESGYSQATEARRVGDIANEPLNTALKKQANGEELSSEDSIALFNPLSTLDFSNMTSEQMLQAIDSLPPEWNMYEQRRIARDELNAVQDGLRTPDGIKAGLETRIKTDAYYTGQSEGLFTAMLGELISDLQQNPEITPVEAEEAIQSFVNASQQRMPDILTNLRFQQIVQTLRDRGVNTITNTRASEINATLKEMNTYGLPEIVSNLILDSMRTGDFELLGLNEQGFSEELGRRIDIDNVSAKDIIDLSLPVLVNMLEVSPDTTPEIMQKIVSQLGGLPGLHEAVTLSGVQMAGPELMKEALRRQLTPIVASKVKQYTVQKASATVQNHTISFVTRLADPTTPLVGFTTNSSMLETLPDEQLGTYIQRMQKLEQGTVGSLNTRSAGLVETLSFDVIPEKLDELFSHYDSILRPVIEAQYALTITNEKQRTASVDKHLDTTIKQLQAAAMQQAEQTVSARITVQAQSMAAKGIADGTWIDFSQQNMALLLGPLEEFYEFRETLFDPEAPQGDVRFIPDESGVDFFLLERTTIVDGEPTITRERVDSTTPSGSALLALEAGIISSIREAYRTGTAGTSGNRTNNPFSADALYNQADRHDQANRPQTNTGNPSVDLESSLNTQNNQTEIDIQNRAFSLELNRKKRFSDATTSFLVDLFGSDSGNISSSHAKMFLGLVETSKLSVVHNAIDKLKASSNPETKRTGYVLESLYTNYNAGEENLSSFNDGTISQGVKNADAYARAMLSFDVDASFKPDWKKFIAEGTAENTVVTGVVTSFAEQTALPRSGSWLGRRFFNTTVDTPADIQGMLDPVSSGAYFEAAGRAAMHLAMQDGIDLTAEGVDNASYYNDGLKLITEQQGWRVVRKRISYDDGISSGVEPTDLNTQFTFYKDPGNLGELRTRQDPITNTPVPIPVMSEFMAQQATRTLAPLFDYSTEPGEYSLNNLDMLQIFANPDTASVAMRNLMGEAERVLEENAIVNWDVAAELGSKRSDGLLSGLWIARPEFIALRTAYVSAEAAGKKFNVDENFKLIDRLISGVENGSVVIPGRLDVSTGNWSRDPQDFTNNLATNPYAYTPALAVQDWASHVGTTAGEMPPIGFYEFIDTVAKNRAHAIQYFNNETLQGRTTDDLSTIETERSSALEAQIDTSVIGGNQGRLSMHQLPVPTDGTGHATAGIRGVPLSFRIRRPSGQGVGGSFAPTRVSQPTRQPDGSWSYSRTTDIPLYLLNKDLAGDTSTVSVVDEKDEAQVSFDITPFINSNEDLQSPDTIKMLTFTNVKGGTLDIALPPVMLTESKGSIILGDYEAESYFSSPEVPFQGPTKLNLVWDLNKNEVFLETNTPPYKSVQSLAPGITHDRWIINPEYDVNVNNYLRDVPIDTDRLNESSSSYYRQRIQ